LSIFFYKIREQEAEQVLLGEAPVGGGEGRGRKMNMVQKFVHMYVNEKIIPVETVPGIKGGEIKKSSDKVNSRITSFIHCKNLCKCHNVPSSNTTIKKIRNVQGER
jgi:hypothetical protein